jgi:hypothetical protein
MLSVAGDGQRWAALYLGEDITPMSLLGKQGFKIKQVYLSGVVN